MVCALVVSSCEDKEKDLPEEPEFKIVIDGRSPSSYPFTADAAEMTIAVQSNGSWTVTVADDAKQWLHVSPAAGENDGSFTLNVDANTTTTARSGSIAFKVGDEAMSSLFVTQAAFGPSITVTPEIAEPFTSAGGDIVFTIAANADWQYSLGDADWLQEKEKSATSLTLTVIANTGVARTATVAFSMTGYPDMNQDVTISQAVAQSVILDEEDFGANATLTGVFNINASELEATIEGIAATPGNYVINVTGNVNISKTLHLPTAGVAVSVRGTGNSLIERTGGADNVNYIVFRIETNATVILRGVDVKKDGTNMPAIYVGGTFVMHEGVSIIGEGVTNAGVDVYNGGTFNMKGGEIRNFKRSGGGAAVFLRNGGTFNMDGGSIHDNEANYGGGIFFRGGTFIMRGGEFYGNKTLDSNDGGGAIYVYAANTEIATLEIYEGAVVYGENGGDGKAGNTSANPQGYGHSILAYTNGGHKYRSTDVKNEVLKISISASAILSSEGSWN